MPERTLVFDTDAEAVRRGVVDAFDALGEQSDIVMAVDGVEEVGEGISTTWFVAVPDERADVAVTIDEQIPASYALIRAVDSSTVDRVARALEHRLPALSADALRDLAGLPDADLGRELQRLAIVVGTDWTPGDVEIVRRGLQAPDPRLRADTAMAIGISPHPMFGPDVARAAERETDPEALRILDFVSRMVPEGD